MTRSPPLLFFFLRPFRSRNGSVYTSSRARIAKSARRSSGVSTPDATRARLLERSRAIYKTFKFVFPRAAWLTLGSKPLKRAYIYKRGERAGDCKGHFRLVSSSVSSFALCALTLRK